MFNKTHDVDTRMAVIEEKFNLYEKMMTKLENAIQTISEINQNISRMLSVHEEKIDSTIKTDNILFEKFKRMEDKNTEDHGRVIDRIEKVEYEIKKIISEEKIEREDHIKNVEQKVEGVVKFRWIIVGAFAVIMFLFSNQSVVFDILTTDKEQGRIEIVK